MKLIYFLTLRASENISMKLTQLESEEFTAEVLASSMNLIILPFNDKVSERKSLS